MMQVLRRWRKWVTARRPVPKRTAVRVTIERLENRRRPSPIISYFLAFVVAGVTSASAAPPGPPNSPPLISNFTASSSVDHIWTFSGQVTDDQSVAGLVVTLGGIPSLQGVTVTTNSQGRFTYTCQLGANESGTATAQTADIWGLASNVAWTIVN